MNINLIYEGKNYNFDIPNNVTIDYLKELSSKIFNSEKELLDLIYNNRKISDNSDNTLIRDLIPEGESNAILTVQINKNLSNNNHKKKKERKISFEHLKERNNKENIKTVEKNSKLNDRYDKYDNEKENHKEKKMKINPKTDESTSSKNEKLLLENIYNNNIQSKIRLMLTNNNRLNYKENKKEKFNNEYLQKNGELLSLIRQFSDKIKKIYLILYNKYKISNKNLSHNTSTLSNVKTTRNENINNNLLDNSFYELALYEKKIMNYLEIQIQHYKLLLDTIKNYDNNINFTKLTDFYHKLFMFIPEDTIINKEQKIKELMKRNKKLNNNNSSINLTSFNKKLPAIKIKNYKSPILKETKKEKLIKEIKMNSNLSINNNNINEFNNNFKQNEFKESKLKKNNKINIEEEDNISLSNNNTNYKNNNILDNISEKNSIESNTDLNENLNNISNVSPIHLKQKNSNRIILEKNENDNNNTPVKEIKLFQRKDTGTTNVSKFKNSLEKKVTLDLDANQNKKDKKVKEINTNSMTVKDSNFALEKNYNIKNKKNSINKYDYVM